MPSNVLRKYGWRPDPPDHRDHMFATRIELSKLPPSVDLRSKCPVVYDQAALGSCTGNALAGAHQFEQIKLRPGRDFIPSRLFIYYNEREMEGTIQEDAGAIIRDGIKTLVWKGVCPETEWPYIENQFTTCPGDACYKHALDHQVTSYKRILQDLHQLKACLAEGYPFVFGFTVYASFESEEVARTGVMKMPEAGEENCGGHAVMCVGYDDNLHGGVFIVRNSWGSGWGDNGYFFMPYQYMTKPGLASDFWSIRMVETDT